MRKTVVASSIVLFLSAGLLAGCLGGEELPADTDDGNNGTNVSEETGAIWEAPLSVRREPTGHSTTSDENGEFMIPGATRAESVPGTTDEEPDEIRLIASRTQDHWTLEWTGPSGYTCMETPVEVDGDISTFGVSCIVDGEERDCAWSKAQAVGSPLGSLLLRCIGPSGTGTKYCNLIDLPVCTIESHQITPPEFKIHTFKCLAEAHADVFTARGVCEIGP